MTFPDFTDAELHAAFLSVACSDDWRKPIIRTAVVKSERDVQRIVRAVEVFAGGGAKTTMASRRDGSWTVTVRAPGHYAMVNRSLLTEDQRRRLEAGTLAHSIAHTIDVDVENKTLTFRCVKCQHVFVEHFPAAPDEEMRRLSVQWSASTTGRIVQCPHCDARPPLTP